MKIRDTSDWIITKFILGDGAMENCMELEPCMNYAEMLFMVFLIAGIRNMDDY